MPLRAAHAFVVLATASAAATAVVENVSRKLFLQEVPRSITPATANFRILFLNITIVFICL
jgi:hypothetical protein